MKILDMCCGGKMFWFDKKHPLTTYIDKRCFEGTLCDGRDFSVNPDIVADFTNLPFEDNIYDLIVFDPPHLQKVGEKSWLAKKYGKLGDNWEKDLKEGFDEGIRVLKSTGTLIFKWNEQDIKISELIKIFGKNPIFGNKTSKNTIWLVFIKN